MLSRGVGAARPGDLQVSGPPTRVWLVAIFDALKSALFGGGDPGAKTSSAKPKPGSNGVRITWAAEPRPKPPEASPEAEGRQYLSASEQPRLLVPDESGALPVTIRDGFFVYVPTGQLMPPANRVLAAHGVVSFRVRGTQHHRGAKFGNTSPGQPATLRREPTNEFDPNAVAVHASTPAGGLTKVGYVNKGLARPLAKRMDAGEAVDALFMRGAAPGEWNDSPCVVIADDAFRLRIRGWPG